MRLFLGISLLLGSSFLLFQNISLFHPQQQNELNTMNELKQMVEIELSNLKLPGFSKVNVNYRLSNQDLQPSQALHIEIKKSFPRTEDSILTAEVEVFDKLDQDPLINSDQKKLPGSEANQPMPLQMVFQVSIFREGNKVSELGLSKEIPIELFSDKKKPQ